MDVLHSGSSGGKPRGGSNPLRPTFLNSWLTRGYGAGPNIVVDAVASLVPVLGTLLGTTLHLCWRYVAGSFRI